MLKWLTASKPVAYLKRDQEIITLESKSNRRERLLADLHGNCLRQSQARLAGHRELQKGDKAWEEEGRTPVCWPKWELSLSFCFLLYLTLSLYLHLPVPTPSPLVCVRVCVFVPYTGILKPLLHCWHFSFLEALFSLSFPNFRPTPTPEVIISRLLKSYLFHLKKKRNKTCTCNNEAGDFTQTKFILNLV